MGGVVAILLLLAIYLYYKCIYIKKRDRYNDEMALDDFKIDPDDSDISRSHRNTISSGETERPQARRLELANSVTRNKRLSSYDSFMRPQARYARGGGRGGARGGARGGRGGRGGQQNRRLARVGTDSDSSKRNSMATTVSTTNASNILPVAYIPGVTVRPTKNNTKSIYSYESESIFSDIHGIDNASIVAAERQNQQSKGTMTAIRAQPRLVNVARIEEGDEEEDDETEPSASVLDHHFNWDMPSFTHSTGPSDSADSHPEGPAHTAYGHAQTSPFGDNHSDPDLDVDSDIGEINQAKGERTRHTDAEFRPPNQALIDVDNTPGDQLTEGLFILDIGRDQ